MNHAMQGHSRWMGHSGEFWENMVHWRMEWQAISIFLPWEPHEQYEKAKRYDTEKWTSQVGRCPICYWRRQQRNNSSRNEEVEPQQKRHQIVDVSGGESKVQYCKECCVGTWNVRSTNQGKLDVVKQEIARVNIDRLSEPKWMGTGRFNSDDHYIYYHGQESLRRNGVAIIVNKRVWNAVLGCNFKNDRMISVHFQGKPFSITVIQAYAPTSNT